VHLIALRNEVRGLAGADPIDPYDHTPAPTEDEEKELQAFKHRLRSNDIIDWEEDLTQ